MSDLRKAAQQALEALEKSGCVAFKGLACRCNSTCASYTAAVALRAALAQQPEPAQEPVAWAFKHSDGTYHDPSATEHSAGMVPLGPIRAQRPRLTDKEIDAITRDRWGTQLLGVMVQAHREYARAIERKVRGEA